MGPANELTCMDLKTGKARWKQPFFSTLRNVMASGGRLAELDVEHNVTMVDGRTGELLWKNRPINCVAWIAADKDGVVIIGMADPSKGISDMIALNGDDGTNAWRAPIKKRQGTWWMYLVGEQVVCVSQAPAGLVLLNRKTGAVVRELDEPGNGVVTGIPTVVNDDKLIIETMQQNERRGYVSCYDLKKGTLLWRVVSPGNQVGFQGLMRPKSVSASGKRIVIGTSQHIVTCLDTDTGQVVWQKVTSSEGVNNVMTVVEGEECYVATMLITATQRTTTLMNLGVSDGAVKWRRTLPQGLQCMDMTVTGDEVAVSTMLWGVGTNFRADNQMMPLASRICLMDRETGKVVQTINPMGSEPGNAHLYMQARLMPVEERLWVAMPQMLVGYASKEE